MIKMTKRYYTYQGKQYTAEKLASHLWKQGKHHRKFGYSYVTANVLMGKEKVRIFLTRKTKTSGWRGYVTTNLKLSFVEAYRIYSMRWVVEVVNKEQKSLLHMDKCQSWYFAAQITHVTLTSLQYNLLALAKRFSDYETIGELFKGTKDDFAEMSVCEKIWSLVAEIAKEVDDELGIDDSIFYAIIYKTEKLKRIVNIVYAMAG